MPELPSYNLWNVERDHKELLLRECAQKSAEGLMTYQQGLAIINEQDSIWSLTKKLMVGKDTV